MMPVGVGVSVSVAKDKSTVIHAEMIMITKGFCDGSAVSVSSVG